MRNLSFLGIMAALGFSAPANPATNGLALRIGSGEKSLQAYKDCGYTAGVFGDVTQLAMYETVCPGVIAQDSELRNRIEHQQRKFQKEYDRANALGIAVCLLTDEVSLPVPILKRLQGGGTGARIDLESNDFWELYRAKYREVLKAYPRVAYVIVRTGENYSHPEEGFVGRTVVEGKYDGAYFRHMQRLIEETRKIVVDEFGRKLIWRTWDLGGAGFHADPRVYDRILNGISNHTGLILSIKFTQTDFWRYNDFNPMIGRGGVAQIVEFECAREYEGKGAFPDYIGPEHAEAMRKARDLGAHGVWIWDTGGGWGGPFLKSDIWVRLNIEATSRLARDPDLSARSLAEAWAAKQFGSKAAPTVAEMLMLSGECINKLMYIAPYARGHHGWKPSLNLMRDDIIRGDPLKNLYEGCRNELPEVLTEKQDASAMAARMRKLFESAHDSIAAERSEQVYQEALTSLIYLESLANVVSHYVSGMFLYYRWRETGEAGAADKAKTELQAWREAWQDYQTKVPTLPEAASLYRSRNAQDAASAKGAMAELCEGALKTLASIRSTEPPM